MRESREGVEEEKERKMALRPRKRDRTVSTSKDQPLRRVWRDGGGGHGFSKERHHTGPAGAARGPPSYFWLTAE